MLKKLYYLSLFVLSLGQLAVLSQAGATKVYLFDILIVLFSAIGFLSVLMERKSYRLSLFLMPFFLFCVWAFFTLIFNFLKMGNDQFLVAFSYLARFFFYVLSANNIYNMLVDDHIKPEMIRKAYILSGIFICMAGFVQLMVLPDFTALDPSLGWDPHKNRLASTFFDPNYTGGYLVLVFTLLLFRDRFDDVSSKKKYFLSVVIIVIGVLLTYSRSAWGMLGVVVLIFSLFRSRWLFLLSLFIAFSAYFAVPRIQTRLSGITDPADSAYFRYISWKNTWNIAKDNLVLGVGYNFFREAQIDYGYLTPDTVKEHSSTGSDSSLLLVLATTGVLGIIIYLFGFISPIIKTRSLYGAAVIVPLLLESNFVNSLFYPQILLLWLTLLVIMEYQEISD